MSTLWIVFDGLLLLAVLGMAWRAVHDADLFRAVVQFIALGLLLAVLWLRLAAPDVALAEAALGSGLTGALLLTALVRMRRCRPDPESSPPEDAP